MPLFGKRPRTAQQKAQRVQMRIFARLACCAYLVFYVIMPLIKDASTDTTGEGGMSPAMIVTVISVFIVITALIFALSVIEVIRGFKTGIYKASSYTDDDGVVGGLSAIKAGSDDEDPESVTSGQEFDDEDDDEDYVDDDDEEET